MSTHESVVLGFDGADDAAAVRLKDGKLLIQTVDFFTPIVDEPYEFGQIAAANSLSDIYAMGGKPLFALNIVGFPINDLPKAILTEILQGGVDKAAEAGIPIVGGHSVDDKEPKYGLVVTGEVDESKMWKNSGAEAGDVLVLTKPLGTGVIATAIKKGAAAQNSIHSAIHSMAALNKDAADHLHGLDVHAVTDVTGFGLLGHLKEMCQNSGVSSKINFSKLNFLPSVFDLAESGIMAGGTRRNLDYLKDYVSFGPNLAELEHLLAADAQTSGGLLISLPNEDAQKFVQSYGPPSGIIGNITEKSSHLITLL
tara:strand:- start:5 stop:937 length:933 start_codon:yes stop_codon:yes gene_type:complete